VKFTGDGTFRLAQALPPLLAALVAATESGGARLRLLDVSSHGAGDALLSALPPLLSGAAAPATLLVRIGVFFGPYKILFYFEAFVNEPSIILLPPPPLVKPALLQYDCNTIAQYSTPLRPPVFMPYTIQYCA